MVSVNNTTSGSNVHSTAAAGMEVALNRSRTTMSAEDIMAYVQQALDNIDGGFKRYKDEIEARQAKANKIRELMSTIRANASAEGGNGHLGADKIKEKLDAALEDPALQDSATQEVLQNLRNSYKVEERDDGGGGQVGADGIAGVDGDGHITDIERYRGFGKEAVVDTLKNLEERLTTLNSDNELVMMNLQKLMQQRNQVTQFSSNVMNMINETLKGVIGNLR